MNLLEALDDCGCALLDNFVVLKEPFGLYLFNEDHLEKVERDFIFAGWLTSNNWAPSKKMFNLFHGHVLVAEIPNGTWFSGTIGPVEGVFLKLCDDTVLATTGTYWRKHYDPWTLTAYNYKKIEGVIGIIKGIEDV